MNQVEVDEIHLRIQGHRDFFGWIAYDPVNKVFVDLQIGKRDEETLEKLFKRLKKYRGKVKLVMIDGYKNYRTLIKRHLSKNGRMPTTGVINKSKWIKKLNGFLTYCYYGKNRNEAIELIERYHIGHTISTALIFPSLSSKSVPFSCSTVKFFSFRDCSSSPKSCFFQAYRSIASFLTSFRWCRGKRQNSLG